MSTDFTILYEDEFFLAIDKPAGITVNKSDTTRYQSTVQDWAENYLKVAEKQYDIPEDKERSMDFYLRAGIAHRIDKETSGILLISKDPETFLRLQSLFKERTIEKKYIALAHGNLHPETGIIALPVGRLPWNRKQFGIVAGGKPAETAYETVGRYMRDDGEVFSLLKLFPKTGRTHQIRVHLKYLNRPIMSDFLYAGRKTSRKDRKDLPRVFLHASEIKFSHPHSGEKIVIESPLPDDLTSYLAHLSIV